MSTRSKSVFDIPRVAAELADIHEKNVALPADKVPNNSVIDLTRVASKIRTFRKLNSLGTF